MVHGAEVDVHPTNYVFVRLEFPNTHILMSITQDHFLSCHSHILEPMYGIVRYLFEQQLTSTNHYNQLSLQFVQPYHNQLIFCLHQLQCSYFYNICSQISYLCSLYGMPDPHTSIIVRNHQLKTIFFIVIYLGDWLMSNYKHRANDIGMYSDHAMGTY